ncbi:thiamine-binding protein [Naumannella halotolerans]|uniref:thiamine-binding protein n=1 Tax=Naumannella halotolerans TaxID=993414 RepID=UPI00105E31E6
MFTEVEGSWDEVFGVVKRATEAVGPFGSRISLVIKADIRAGCERELDGKVERLERAIEETVEQSPRVTDRVSPKRDTPSVRVSVAVDPADGVRRGARLTRTRQDDPGRCSGRRGTCP